MVRKIYIPQTFIRPNNNRFWIEKKIAVVCYIKKWFKQERHYDVIFVLMNESPALGISNKESLRQKKEVSNTKVHEVMKDEEGYSHTKWKILSGKKIWINYIASFFLCVASPYSVFLYIRIHVSCCSILPFCYWYCSDILPMRFKVMVCAVIHRFTCWCYTCFIIFRCRALKK